MIKKLFLDLNNFKSNLGSVERGDSIELNIKLLDSEDYSRNKFRVLGTKADGKYVEQIEGINLEGKDLKVILEDQFVNCEGIVKLELNVVSVETEITTKEFYFFVSNTMNASIIDSADSLPTLEKVSKYVDDAVDNLEALKGASEDITIINSEFKENEIKRKANEMLREKNEKARLQSEDIRITEEKEREANELERIQAENDRKVSESNRKLAENKRKTNEAARVEAELNRQSLFEENEEIRNSNENLRIASEKERIKFNSEAKTDELNRKESEKNRVLAEEERKSSEEARVSAEAIRQNTYTDFNDSEVERKNNEIKREEAEALRVEAETRRDNLFSEKEEERNTSFIESEKVRNAAFNKAQDSRNTTFEESETVREEAFKISEKARNDAEELRVTAESERVKSEKLRVDSEKARVLAEEERNTTFTQKEEERNNTFTQNETNRNYTFTQSEEERQGVFEEAENARKVAESKRVAAETGRVEAEKLRVTAETERVEAENLRVTAEEERVAAETKREEGFNKFDGKINANTKELKNARTATTGEKFNSLDERIDCEVDRLNKKIEVSFLQQEDKGSHTIENAVEGMTTDMVVKGKTMYKKSDGSYTDTWEEGVTIESFGEQEGNKISILSNGKNLFNINGNVNQYYPNMIIGAGGVSVDNNHITTTYNSSNSMGKGFIVKNALNKKYIITADVASIGTGTNAILTIHYKDKSNVIMVREKSKMTITFTSERDEFLLGFSTENGVGAKFTNVLIETAKEGQTTASDYENYKEDKKDILLSQYGFDEGFRGLSDNVYDELNNAKSVVIKRIEKYIFTGDEDWGINPAVENNETMYFHTNALDSLMSQSTQANSIICNILPTTANYEASFALDSITNTIGSRRIRLRLNKNKLETLDLDGLKKWLKANPTTIYYELAEPIETPLDENINLKTFNEKTYVSFENSISGTSSFKAPVNTVATIARLNRENRALEEENKNLRQDFESTTLTLTDSDLELVKQNVDMDFRLMEVEFALDIPQAILSSNIKFKNKKGEVKSMARTPYEMMKIVILSGDYDREDYMHKVGKYYERGRMTKEEHDELMSLMTADEVISK